MANSGQQKLKDAESKIAGMLNEGSIVNLNGMDPEMAESVATSIETVLTKYPSVKDAFSGFTTDDTDDEAFSGDSKTMAAYDPNTRLIHMNNQYYGNKAEFEKRYTEAVEKQFHPEGTTADSVVVHEMGHAIDYYVSKKTIPRERFIWGGEKVSTRIWNNAIDAGRKSGEPLTGKSIREGLSGYASSKPSEYLAEGFAEFMMSPNPRPTATHIGKRVEYYIKRAEKVGD